MVTLPFLRRCRVCGSKEGLKACVVCGRNACQLHLVAGKCYACIEREPFTIQETTGVTVQREDRRKALPDALRTELKFDAEPLKLLEDLYLLLGGRPGSRRSTTVLGSLHLDQVRRSLMFDRNIARRITSTSFVRLKTATLAEVETRRPSHLADGYGDKDVLAMIDSTTRLAHDQLIRMIDLVCLSMSAQRVQILEGAALLEEVNIGEEVPCPYCGNWRGVCQCTRKVEGSISASGYFKTAMGSSLRQRSIALEMRKDPKNAELRERVVRWRRALQSY